MANNKNPSQKQPGEKEPGTFHYDPGNMSGKTIGTNEDQSQKSDADRIPDRHQDQDKDKKSLMTGDEG